MGRKCGSVRSTENHIGVRKDERVDEALKFRTDIGGGQFKNLNNYSK